VFDEAVEGLVIALATGLLFWGEAAGLVGLLREAGGDEATEGESYQEKCSISGVSDHGFHLPPADVYIGFVPHASGDRQGFVISGTEHIQVSERRVGLQPQGSVQG